MDRLPIASAIPADRAEVLTDCADVMRSEPTDKELDEARGEIADEIIAGERVAGIDRLYVLEAELNRDELGLQFLRELAPVLFGTADREDYLREIVCKHIPDEVVHDRAWETLCDREADRMESEREAREEARRGW